MDFLRSKVHLKGEGKGSEAVIGFESPQAEELAQAGLNADGFARIRAEPWWDEMVTDIVETPEMCEPDDSPQQVLEYARDVVSEYIRKRAKL
jgi:hypothetical protein